jgi:hypothetical protein
LCRGRPRRARERGGEELGADVAQPVPPAGEDGSQRVGREQVARRVRPLRYRPHWPFPRP